VSSLCCLVVAEDAQVRGEISGVGVIVAESAATPGQGVLIHAAGFVVALAVILLHRQNSWPLVCRVEVCSPLM